MKFELSNDELAWLHTHAQSFATVAANRRESEMASQAKRLAYVTTPNARFVYLKRAQRELVLDMVRFRLKLLDQDTLNPGTQHEAALLVGLARKLLPTGAEET